MGTVAEEYRDFRCFEVEDSGEHSEVEVEIAGVKNLLVSEAVYLFVRYDIRRIFIWKGPRSPVRKRFISSRAGSKIQETCAKTGMHLKIISVDAGDEPREFLKVFNLESYEVSDDDMPEDMYYVRNDERRKLEEDARLALEGGGESTSYLGKIVDSPSSSNISEAQITEENASSEEKPKKKSEYWSPLTQESDRLEKMEAAKKKAVLTSQEITDSLAGQEKPKLTVDVKKKKVKEMKDESQNYGYAKESSHSQIQDNKQEEEKAILDLILSQEIPAGKKRLNIIIGNSLFGVKRMISTLFGKQVEEEKWDRVSVIPDGNIDIDTELVRAYCKDNQIKGFEILSLDDDKESSKTEETKEEIKESGKSKSTRKLNAIPKGE